MMSYGPTIDETLSDLRTLSTDPSSVEFSALTRFMRTDNPVFDALTTLAKTDPTKPYGRRVLLETDALEMMVACWTPGTPCAPHDHGGSLGAVRVLQGRARHRIWRCVDGELRVVREELVSPGEVMSCGSDLIHSMGDDGATEPLITLHMYTDSIDHMVVYDLDSNETLVVEGSCGAWVPRDTPGMIRQSYPGIREPVSVR